MPGNDAPASTSKADSVLLLVQEMLIDAFGIVIPGFCFLVLALATIGLPLADLSKELGPQEHVSGLRYVLANHSTSALVASLLFAFVAGHILYRQDPKNPDKLSIWCRGVAKKDAACVRADCVEGQDFPYSHLKEYLLARNFGDLAEYVDWSGRDFYEPKNNKARWRSKHFMNRLKLSIKLKDSRLYFDILRNEAHIRLASSVWYGSAVLIVFSVVGLLIGFSGNYFPNHKWQHIESLIISGMIMLLSVVTLFAVSLSFHYQRVREIVYVLQTALLLGIQKHSLNEEPTPCSPAAVAL
jgi:hypothetical protein